MYKLSLIIFSLLLMAACSKNDETTETIPLKFTYDFTSNSNSWQGGFADYPAGQEAFYELEFGHSTLPTPLDEFKGSLRQSGNNHSDDLFMFIKRKITGLNPDQIYQVTFDIEIATNVPDNLFGVGGSPGESVFIKAGMTQTEPLKELHEGDYRMNIDKSNQSGSGSDMIVIGDFANETNEYSYTLKSLTNKNTFEVQASTNGELWAIVGTDSGFEATTTIYYNKISIVLE